MEYVALRASHPSWLTMQLPSDAITLLKFRDPSPRSPGDGTGSITFLARGGGIARVFATHLSREALAVESVRERVIATARPGDRHLFALPTALLEHLQIEVSVRGPRSGKGTDDQILWFVPADEYYSFRKAEADGAPWHGPSLGAAGHVYVAKAILPPPRALAGLATLDEQIERGEWVTATEAFAAPARVRRASEPR